jgi:hypothetical protein
MTNLLVEFARRHLPDDRFNNAGASPSFRRFGCRCGSISSQLNRLMRARFFTASAHEMQCAHGL